VHKKLLVRKYTAIRQLISCQIRRSISIYAGESKNINTKVDRSHLYKGRDKNRIFYVTSVALKLSKSHNMRALEVAHGIRALLAENLGDLFCVHVNPSGLIHVGVSDQYLAGWLQDLGCLDWQSGVGNAGVVSDSPALFTAQYVHARCCSLLRLGEQEGLIPLNAIACNISWLDDRQKLRCDRSTSRQLISELVQMVDWLYGEYPPSKVVKWEQEVVSLINAFEAFWGDCRMWGEVKSQYPELARMRLGLVLATRVVLKLLLVDKLGLIAPESL
jgi:arginyl-tRNA synthetase